MKKFLSMVLALVMVMSLVTVGAGAKDFNDNSEIEYQKAVAVLSEIGVVDGYEDGSFNPTVTLNRGQAAKIICNLILGPTTANALSADAAPFSDVPADHHFAGYIAYCAQQGIISGYADGTFRPTGTLTGYAFMKMLLGALGYDADIEGYVGSNWSINVAKQALAIELDDGNDNFVGQQAVTREEACLYAFNTLTATMVDYDSKTTVEINGATVNVGNSKAYEVERTSGKDYTGASESSDKYDSCGTQQFCEKYFDDLTADKTERDDFGRPATKWSWDGDKIGTYADDPDETLVVPDANKSLKMLMTDGDYLDYGTGDINETAKVFYNGMSLTDDEADSVYKNLASETDLAGKGDIIEVFEDGDNDADTIVIRSYTYAKIDEVDDELSKTLQNKDATVGLDLIDIDGNDLGNGTYYDDHDDDELVLNGFSADTYTEGTVIAVALGEKDAIVDSYVVESVTGEPTAARAVELYSYVGGESSKGVKNGTITVDGTKYTYAAQFTGLDENAKVDFDKEYVVYLTAEGYALAVDGDAAASLSDVYYVVGVYGERSKGEVAYYAQAISVDDGVEETLKLDDDNDGKATATLRGMVNTTTLDFVEVHAFYKFDSDGSSYDAYKYTGSSKYDVVENATLTNDVTNSSSVIRLSKTPSKLYLDDTTFFIGAEDVGTNLDVTTATGVMTADASSEIKVAAIYDDDDAVFVVYAAKELNGAADKSDLVYMTDNANTRASKDTFIVDLFSLKSMDLMEDVEIDDDESKQGFYIYSVDSDDIYDLDKPKTSSKLSEFYNGTEVDDDSDGYAEGVKFTSGKNQSASDTTNSFVAVDFSDATIIDTRGAGDKKADAYSNDITTASRLTSALTKGWVVCDVYVEDGDIVFIAVVDCMDDGETNPYSFKAVETGTANIIL